MAAHHDDLARVCFVICGDQDMAQDAVQAAWPIAWCKLGSLRDPERLRPWLVSVAANQARQTLRRHPTSSSCQNERRWRSATADRAAAFVRLANQHLDASYRMARAMLDDPA